MADYKSHKNKFNAILCELFFVLPPFESLPTSFRFWILTGECAKARVIGNFYAYVLPGHKKSICQATFCAKHCEKNMFLLHFL
jgi:hypothetical protein